MKAGLATRETEVGYELPVIQKQMHIVKARLYTLPFENFHTHDEIAKEDGLGEAVPQGLMSYGYLSEMCTLFFGNSWANGGTFNVNFVGMLRKNDLLTVRGKVKEKVEEDSTVRLVLEVSVENDRGELVAVGTASGLVD